MSAANYALCDSCDGKVFYVGDADIPLGTVVTHVECQLRELAKVRADTWREAIEALRTDEAWKAAQQAVADEWHEDACHCDAWPASCVAYPQSFAPSSWHPETVAPHFAAFLESLAPKETKQ